MKIILGGVHRKVDWFRVTFWLSVTGLGLAFLLVGVKVFALPPPPPWDENNIALVSSKDITGDRGHAGGCFTEDVVMKTGERIYGACVFGYETGVRVARFPGGSSGTMYVVSFPGSQYFYTMSGVCTGRQNCAYGQAADTFVIESTAPGGANTYKLLTNFSKKLQRQQGVATYFTIDPQNLESLPNNSYPQAIESFAVSSSGEWAVFEMSPHGFLRVNLATLEKRRIKAPGYSYGYGFNPRAELAISDDGGTVAAAGLNVTPEIIQITDGCGGLAEGNIKTGYEPHEFPCSVVSLGLYRFFGEVRDTYRPVLNHNGTALGLDVFVKGKSAPVRVVLQDKSSPAAAFSRDDTVYLAFGDSFTSGEGETDAAQYVIGTSNESNRCHVSNRSYPYLVGSGWDLAVQNKACSGSRIDDVSKVIASTSTEIAADTVYLSIGVGGNDIGLMGKLSSCIGPGTCEWAEPGRRQATYKEIQRQQLRLEGLVDQANQDFPGAKVALVSYPRVVNVSGSSNCSLLVKALLNEEERRYMDASVAELNRVIANVAAAKAVNYIDIESSMVGMRLCDQSDIGMNTVRFGGDIAPIKGIESFKVIGAESFHPTPVGHSAIASAILAKYPQPWAEDACGDCGNQSADPSANQEYWKPSGVAQNQTNQYAGKFLATDVLPADTRKVAVSFSPGTFAPTGKVTFEVHSDPVELGEIDVAADGSLIAELSLSKPAAGYHTVHAYGKNFAGEDVEYYQAIALEVDQDAAQDDPNDSTVGGVGAAPSSGSGGALGGSAGDIVAVAVGGAALGGQLSSLAKVPVISAMKDAYVANGPVVSGSVAEDTPNSSPRGRSGSALNLGATTDDSNLSAQGGAKVKVKGVDAGAGAIALALSVLVILTATYLAWLSKRLRRVGVEAG